MAVLRVDVIHFVALQTPRLDEQARRQSGAFVLDVDFTGEVDLYEVMVWKK